LPATEESRGTSAAFPFDTAYSIIVLMSKLDKLISAIRDNPKSVRFVDACKAAESVGFARAGGKGSHTVYARKGESVILNFQNRGGQIPPYQARQLIAMLEVL
jgi:hypothetical protein